jgi:hypothetical protein
VGEPTTATQAITNLPRAISYLERQSRALAAPVPRSQRAHLRAASAAERQLAS